MRTIKRIINNSNYVNRGGLDKNNTRNARNVYKILGGNRINYSPQVLDLKWEKGKLDLAL